MSVSLDARKNLEMAGLFRKDSDYNGMIGEAVMKLVDTHFSEGHSGMSHKYVLMIFNKVVNNQALTKEFWDMKKAEMEKFAQENMAEPWEESLLEEMLGKRPN